MWVFGFIKIHGLGKQIVMRRSWLIKYTISSSFRPTKASCTTKEYVEDNPKRLIIFKIIKLFQKYNKCKLVARLL